jgi:hypothetical protein
MRTGLPMLATVRGTLISAITLLIGAIALLDS